MRNGFSFFDFLGFSLDEIDPLMLTNFVRKDEIERLSSQLLGNYKLQNGTNLSD